MNKDIFRYLIVFAFLFLIGSYGHQFLLEYLGLQILFSLENLYLFHASFSAFICVNLRVFSTVDKFFSQLGFIYLSTLVFKIIFFFICFYNPLFTIVSFSFAEKLAFFFPLFVFLLTEAVFVLKILTQKE
jgi:hypothetical protein